MLNPLKDLKKGGFDLTLVPVDSMGIIDLAALESLLSKETVLTSVMYANSEIGTIQPIKEVSDLVHEKGLFLHVDAAAAAGKIAVDVQKDGIDLLTLSSNDLYGPQGAGALYVKPGVRIQPVLFGGGQERGLRPGTENLYALAGFGEAARLAKLEKAEESQRLQAIRDGLIKEILKIEESYLTGHPTQAAARIMPASASAGLRARAFSSPWMPCSTFRYPRARPAPHALWSRPMCFWP